jgi:hypothetical protein
LPACAEVRDSVAHQPLHRTRRVAPVTEK